jgi:hypothetical protein
MRIQQRELQHPTQVSRLRLTLYRYDPAGNERVAGLMPDQPGFHVTEERVGTRTVVSSLGFFAEQPQALDLLQRREHELAAQGWRAAAGPPAAPSIPPGPLTASEPGDPAAARAYGADPPRVAVPDDPTPRPRKPA